MVISDNIKREYINALTSELKLLRAKANISQADLAGILGISRQTYCQIENGSKEMPWSTYLSLIFFFDSIEPTSKLLLLLEIYPLKFVNTIKEVALMK